MARWTVAVTGGVASGKSEATRIFQALGLDVIDADVAAREVVAPGQPGLAAVRDHFGAESLQADGQLDRAWMRQRIFADPRARRELESLLHPLIRQRLAEGAAASKGPYAVVAIPLLAEGGGRDAYPWLQRILVVDAPPALQRQRLLARDGGDAAQAQRMLDAQSDRPARLALADDVVVNDGSREQLAAAVSRLDARYRALSGNTA